MIRRVVTASNGVVIELGRTSRLFTGSARGPTNPDNDGPLCARHNHLEELGFTITRDDDGHWHITAPDGTQIC
jgi:hypothetical protein